MPGCSGPPLPSAGHRARRLGASLFPPVSPRARLHHLPLGHESSACLLHPAQRGRDPWRPDRRLQPLVPWRLWPSHPGCGGARPSKPRRRELLACPPPDTPASPSPTRSLAPAPARPGGGVGRGRAGGRTFCPSSIRARGLGSVQAPPPSPLGKSPCHVPQVLARRGPYRALLLRALSAGWQPSDPARAATHGSWEGRCVPRAAWVCPASEEELPLTPPLAGPRLPHCLRGGPGASGFEARSPRGAEPGVHTLWGENRRATQSPCSSSRPRPCAEAAGARPAFPSFPNPWESRGRAWASHPCLQHVRRQHSWPPCVPSPCCSHHLLLLQEAFPDCRSRGLRGLPSGPRGLDLPHRLGCPGALDLSRAPSR